MEAAAAQGTKRKADADEEGKEAGTSSKEMSMAERLAALNKKRIEANRLNRAEVVEEVQLFTLLFLTVH